MAKSDNCWGHCEREKRKNKINKLLTSSEQSVDTSTRVLIKRGPVSEETSLSELEEIYARTSAWKKIENGGVLGVPVEEPNLQNLTRIQVDLALIKLKWAKELRSKIICWEC